MSDYIDSFLYNLIALFTSISSLISTNPSEWDAQTLLPPLITFLTAYLALISLYRTTSWMIRTSLWFIKWGTIISIIIASLGWLLGTANSIGFPGAPWIVSSLNRYLIRQQNTAAPSRASSRRRRVNPKPKPWDSFERHRKWRQKEQENGDALKVIDDIIGATGQALKQSRWWEVLKGVVDGTDVEQVRVKVASAKGKSSRSR